MMATDPVHDARARAYDATRSRLAAFHLLEASKGEQGSSAFVQASDREDVAWETYRKAVALALKEETH